MSQTHDNASSESLKSLVDHIDRPSPVILLPEFQRDFVWEVEQTHALFDSLVRGIFVGSIIYGKPSFEMTLRNIDDRPRKGKGKNKKILPRHYSEEEIKRESQLNGLKIVLDGQQRVTSVYRALKGIDKVYFTLRPDVDSTKINDLTLEDLMHSDIGISGEDRDDFICIPMHYAFSYMLNAPFDDEVKSYFLNETNFGKNIGKSPNQDEVNAAFRLFRQMLPKFKTMFEQPQLLSYYLLDMNLDKFTTFFERSNSRGIQLNFTDILAAKVFGGFNLRNAFSEFGDSHKGLPVNRELLVRATALLTGRFSDKIEKSKLLTELKADDFTIHWPEVTELYDRALGFLIEQKFAIALKWLPYDNMLIPLMMFFKELENQSDKTIDHSQYAFIQWWYWASIFSERYTAASNEKITTDVRILQKVARRENIEGNYFLRFRPSIDDSEELTSYTRSQSAIYRGVLNLVHFEGSGMRDWTNGGLISTGPLGSKELQDHHFFPKGYLKKSSDKQDCSPDELDVIKDCVLNRVLMPKETNLKISDKKPFDYLRELSAKNSSLKKSLASHLIPEEIMTDESASYQVRAMLLKRGEAVLESIRRETVEREPHIRAEYVLESPTRTSP
ncbi:MULTISPECIES: DUF262 domain-containing protein [unclassified Deinococcus]|uniref:DUF262 domain-containing protein n=1 Tax=unclassified Deinococcus TaxID=2623546 RepID=UPI001C30897E|nr:MULTISPECIES: DUF262 domain-containing protein [unclassified Deinococcus]MDK2011839.1 DUF262 domain-containing protein [Deinococcus sp. 43]